MTGFGLLGHLHNLMTASGCAARIVASEVPVYDFVRSYAEAGLVPGTCHTDTSGSRTDAKIWQQEPVAGSLVDFGTTVDIWVGLDCDIYEGTRVAVD